MLTKIRSWWKSIREEKPKGVFVFESYQCGIDVSTKKPKPKPKNEGNEQVEAMTAHYLSIIDSGLNLYEFKPEKPIGNMATNRYAQESYTNQLVAFARAIGINSQRNEYFDKDAE